MNEKHRGGDIKKFLRFGELPRQQRGSLPLREEGRGPAGNPPALIAPPAGNFVPGDLGGP